MRIVRPPFRYVLILVSGVLLGMGLSVGRSVQAQREIEPPAHQQPDPPVRWQDARLLAEVLERVRKDYVENISEEELINAAIRGLVADLDQHSAYLDPEEFNEIRISTSGEYSGVGIEVALEKGAVRVVNPIDEGPAARAGVKAGDTIVAVDGVPVDLENINDSIDRMRGVPGSTVKITIARAEAPKPLEFTLARASVQVHSVRKELFEHDVGYVRISHFSETTAPDMEQAIAALKKQSGGKLRGLVLDLRNNPGGVLEAAVGVSDAFLDQGVIVTANGRAPDAKFEMDAKAGDVMQGAPIVVLVNGGSASASEIVAGALQDNHRAKLLGQQTYGKGSVQTVMPLSDGHAIKLTTSKYFTPSGASIHEKGIKPDIVIGTQEIEEHGNVDKPEVQGNLAADYELRVALETLKSDSNKPIRQSKAP
jgi:carboxyl-terminal processing protease